MIDLVLGIIALASVTTVIVENCFAVMLLRTSRRIKARVERVADRGRSLRTHAAAIASHAAKSQILAARQVDRVQDASVVTMSVLRPVITAIGVARSLAAVLDQRRASRR